MQFFSVKERKSSLPRSQECYRSPWCHNSIRTDIRLPASRDCWLAAEDSAETTTGCQSRCLNRRAAATNQLSPCNSRRTFDTWSKLFYRQAWPSRAARALFFAPVTSDPSSFRALVSYTSVPARHSRTPHKSRVLIKINYLIFSRVWLLSYLFIYCSQYCIDIDLTI